MRCEDCLDDLPSVHFVVPDINDDGSDGACVDYGNDKHVCHDCAGWYGDDAVETTT